MIVIVVMTKILKKRCQTIQMMMDIMDIMETVDMMAVIIIMIEDTKEKPHQ